MIQLRGLFSVYIGDTVVGSKQNYKLFGCRSTILPSDGSRGIGEASKNVLNFGRDFYLSAEL
tara:strand:- start:3806 stop:3991 length:186 start_codon:yes stop_codon:yes gene_type:complete